MFQYLLPFALTLSLSAILTQIIRKLSLKWKLFDYPSPRKIHQKPIPRIGGIGIFLSFLIISLIFFLFIHPDFRFSFFSWWGIDRYLVAMLLGGGFITLVMIIDDLKGLSPWAKLFFQIISALLIILAGVKVPYLRLPFGYHIEFNFLYSSLFIIFWILLLTNSVNFLDGLDGLATGVGAISAGILFFLSFRPEVSQPQTALLSAILAGALLGFLPFNFYPAKIFLGDSGSMFLGFSLATIAIISGGKVATLFLVLGIAILDALVVIAVRIARRVSPFHPDLSHLHHQILFIGFSPSKIVLFFYFLAILFGLVALRGETAQKFTAFLILLGIMIIITTCLFMIRLKRR